MAVQTQIQTRRGTAATWTSTNPTLAAGEIGFETDTGKFKIGTGSVAWNSLAYAGSATATTYLYNATAGQTTFSGSDANSQTLAYTAGAEQVYLNGVLLVRGTDYTASNGTSVVLASGAVASDVLNIVAFASFSVANTVALSSYTAKGDVVVGTGASTVGTLGVGADGSTLVANSSASTGVSWTGNQAAGKNGVINGGFDIWQRGTSIACNGAFNYGADHWQMYNGTAQTMSQQASGLTGFRYCARNQRNSSSTSTTPIVIDNTLETANAIPYAGQNTTISFWAKIGSNFSGASNQIVYQLIGGTGTDQTVAVGMTGQTTINSQTIALTTSWQKFSYTAAVGSTYTELCNRFYYVPTGTAGANDYFEITGVQFELGSAATTFTRAGGTLQGELAACQRYYYRQSGSTSIAGLGLASSSTQAQINVVQPVTMRVGPTAIDYANLNLWNGAATFSISSLTINAANTSNTLLTASSTGLTSTTSYGFLASSGGYLGLSAEL